MKSLTFIVALITAIVVLLVNHLMGSAVFGKEGQDLSNHVQGATAFLALWFSIYNLMSTS